MRGGPSAGTPLWVDPGTRRCLASAWPGVRAPKHFRGLCSLADLQSCPLSLHALGGPRRPRWKKTPAPSGPLSREVTTPWPGPLLSSVVPALLLRALRGPVDCSSACFPPPARAPPLSAQRPGRLQVRPRTLGWASCLPAEAGGGGSHRPGQALSPRAPSSQEAGPRPLPLPCRLQPASPHLLLQAFPRSQSPERVASTGSLGPAPGASPALVGADPLHRAGTPPSPPAAWR